MSAWPGKYVIGLTGNIATGKSVVRKMLEHLGAYGIDADALAHRASAQGAPGYAPVVELFGRYIVAPDGQIDRAKLGRIVFADPEALIALEKIIHPLVGEAVDIMVRRAPQKVIVLEAIKLIEAGLRVQCDSLWVTYAPAEVQLARLMQKRNIEEADARRRIAAQSPQEKKVAAAEIVIRNDATYEETWRQVARAWARIVPGSAVEPAQPVAPVQSGALHVERARPKQSADIAALITRLSNGRRSLSRADVMAAFGEKAYLVLYQGERAVGVAGWKVENLVARIDDLFLESGLVVTTAMRALLDEMERASRELQCEASLIFLPATAARDEAAVRGLGYQTRTVQSLGVRAWQEAAIESMPANSILLFKQLRADRVLRPV
jgi:dephospho-CoA kinase